MADPASSSQGPRDGKLPLGERREVALAAFLEMAKQDMPPHIVENARRELQEVRDANRMAGLHVPQRPELGVR
jgi:hypothetical protein